MKLAFASVFSLLAWSLAADPATVQIKEASLYEKPSAISKFLGKIPYGTQLTIVSSQAGWVQVKSDALGSGWLRDQAITTKKLAMKSGTQSSGVSATEVSLAGRGFSEEIEKGYKAKNPNLDYADVDKMEAMGVDDTVLQTFLVDGGVVAGGKR